MFPIWIVALPVHLIKCLALVTRDLIFVEHVRISIWYFLLAFEGAFRGVDRVRRALLGQSIHRELHVQDIYATFHRRHLLRHRRRSLLVFLTIVLSILLNR